MHDRYAQSNALLERALRSVPLASQTFSKSLTQYPQGSAPMFAARGEGGRLWDVDGNEYVDLVCGLLPVVLGYRDPDVDRAIADQMEAGISFSLATTLEFELAERLVEIIPCAEMVRYGKNGTDATSAAIRLARAYTGRDRVIACGYHGWQDWYIGATVRNKGVPKAVRDLTKKVPFNDMDTLRDAFADTPGEVAALIMEPGGAVEPVPDFLAEAKELAEREGAILIFDEIVTGFRVALGGAQEYYGVTPDIAAFGKAMGNGMPISAVVGRAEIMAEMEEIFFSATFGGEALSLAAAIAVIDKMRREPVIKTLWRTGDELADRAAESIEDKGLENVVSLAGIAPWKLLAFHDHPQGRKEAVKTLFIREMLANGVLVNASHNVCYAHSRPDIDAVANAYDMALTVVAKELERGSLESRLGAPVIEPVFSVRPAAG